MERGYAALRRAAANPYLRVAYFLALATIARWPMLDKASMLNDFRDAHYNTLFEEVARMAVARFHQLPLWNPYYCGGVPGLGTPSARFVSPTFLLTLALGTLRADALIAVGMTLVGLEGTYRYLLARGAGVTSAMLAAPIFAMSGVFAHTPTMGWMNFLGFELVPWALLGIRQALGGSRRGVVIAAVAVAWMIGYGGTYTGPLTLLAAAFEVIEALAKRARAPRRIAFMLAMGLAVVVLAGSLSLVRLWPIAETLSSSPRIIGGTPGETPKHVWELLFGDRARHFRRADFLIGLPLVPLIVLGSGRKRSLAITVSALVWVWLAFGFKAPGSPTGSLFALLRVVPPYTMLRAPERFLVFVALGAAGMVALGVRRLETAARKHAGYVVAAAICQVLLLADTTLLILNDHAESMGRHMVNAPTTVVRDFRQTRGNRWVAAYYPWMSRGSLSCFDDYDIAQSPDLRGDLPQEEYLEDPSAGRVTRTAWTPDRIDLDVDLRRPARVRVNQNWHPGWRSSVGQVVSSNGLLAVEVPAGTQHLTLRFLPRSAVGGIATALLGLVAAAALWRRARRGDTVGSFREWISLLGLAALPFSAALAAYLLVNEPRRPPPASVTPAGEPMIVDAPPADAAPVGARWNDGISLEAAEVRTEPRDDGQSVLATVELDWKIDRPLQAGLGVFVHFETNPKDRFSADHVLLSGTMLFDDAPLHKVVRDVSVPVIVSLGATEATWKVYVGIWRARRDQKRVPVADFGPTGGGEDRVLAGSFTLPAKE